MTYATPDGGFSVPAPRGEELGDGRLWESRRIRLQASNQDCSDGMSDNRYPQTVRAVVDGRTLEGCGGEPVNEGGGVVGYGGCNRFSGSYSRSGDTLTFGPMMSTRRACAEPVMRRERRLFEILGQPVTVSFPDGQSLLLTSQRGAIRLQRTN
jgi:hypothetical protein